MNLLEWKFNELRNIFVLERRARWASYFEVEGHTSRMLAPKIIWKRETSSTHVLKLDSEQILIAHFTKNHLTWMLMPAPQRSLFITWFLSKTFAILTHTDSLAFSFPCCTCWIQEWLSSKTVVEESTCIFLSYVTSLIHLVAAKRNLLQIEIVSFLIIGNE